MDSTKAVIDSVNTGVDTLVKIEKAVIDTVSTSVEAVANTVSEVAPVAAEASTSFMSLLGQMAGSLNGTEAELGFPMLFGIIGGLAIFLLGMNYMSTGLQTVAGPKLRSLIGAVTKNRFFAALTGVLVTTIVQSSSVTTVMVVGFVNSGIMALTEALGVIFGANIGTTITGWMIALKVGKYGLPLLAISAIFYLFSKKDRIKYTSMAFMGIGMVFFGLELMKHGFAPMKSVPAFQQFFSLFTIDLSNGFTFGTYLGVIKCGLIGAVLTALVQSSSATLGITITLAMTGAINFETAAALVLGQNIGTTVTAFLASLNTNTAAKRAAYGHMLFNIIGVLWITAIFGFYIGLVEGLYDQFADWFTANLGKDKYAGHESSYLAVKIAMVHTGFNVVNTLIFVPMIPMIANFLMRVVPDKDYKEKKHLSTLGTISMHESPALAIEESKLEVDRMATLTKETSGLLLKLLKSDEYDEKDVAKLFELEEKHDIYQKEISEFLMALLTNQQISHDMAVTIQRQFRFADEYESISDYFTGVLKRVLRLKSEGIELGKDELADMIELHERADHYLVRVNKSVRLCNFDDDPKLIVEAESVKVSFKEKRQSHLTRLKDGVKSPLLSVSYMDILNYYRSINDHLINIAEVMAR
jgi:phosphate:Na+ symporter